ncbi:hypothetical protein EMIT0P253_50215 [Pseudomonas sp. IT-P253]|jgi:hypothetical protein
MKADKNWVKRGKSILELIKELESFEDKSLIVELSLDGGATSKPISLVGKKNGKCLLINLDE